MPCLPLPSLFWPCLKRRNTSWSQTKEEPAPPSPKEEPAPPSPKAEDDFETFLANELPEMPIKVPKEEPAPPSPKADAEPEEEDFETFLANGLPEMAIKVPKEDKKTEMRPLSRSLSKELDAA
jgi:hypothetical protein